MLKIAAAAVATLVVATSPATRAQNYAAERQGLLSAAEPGSLTNLRVEVVKAALQLTAEQEKYWPPIEQAIRERAQHRMVRLENYAEHAADLHESDPIDLLRDHNPVDFMHHRADVLAQRSSDLKKLADAWQPLYQVLSPDQARRLTLLRLIAFRAIINRTGEVDAQFDDDNDE